MYLNDIYTVSANLAGVPAISLPCGLSSDGLPIGLQLIGNFWSEGLLLNLANVYEVENPLGAKPAVHV
jgi:aspartyl-tRNA(Asn)/glutamyl-tRNA(Gln) amidotransferase subunit A